ncbi:hypothetical protein HUJ04_003969 [Dendroctonus ponderosae]|nr:hypothetical protein HUJ04_003969 [Dendroctonus ponderosae]
MSADRILLSCYRNKEGSHQPLPSQSFILRPPSGIRLLAPTSFLSVPLPPAAVSIGFLQSTQRDLLIAEGVVASDDEVEGLKSLPNFNCFSNSSIPPAFLIRSISSLIT